MFNKLGASIICLSTAFVQLTQAVNYWPIDTPSQAEPWVQGQPMNIVWGTGDGTGVSTFDIQLHNPNKTILNGFLPLAQRVPLKKFTSGSRKGQFGGELGIDLDATAGLGGMVGDGFSLIFMDTVSGTVYHKSKKFPIYAGAESPANYTTASLPDGPPATTATITAAPNPTQQWAITLDGTVVGGEVTSIAGGPGGGH
ncbi:hypothetical protein HD553DRAFT_285905 [Filobasidium floriforme]|uniref:uncharacterized protein n=1 Tax=Filobasidium floriforme TaxID=5210 RepID=UPI001E8D0F35|nr:uncharacterized protein HD553DRAFT_285905 [Filobasidium floriforme]KAH8083234.1 hypothetical protein HD553DRAFT_285905 [Filobasidium floriforme]